MSTDALLSDNACAAAPSALARTCMSTASVDVRDRFAYWNDMVCAAYVPLECEPPEACEIVGEIALSRLGPLELTQLHSSVRKVRRTPRLIGRDAHDFCLVQVQRSGSALVSQGGRQATVRQGDFVVYETSRPYELCFGGPTHEVIVVRLPRAALAPHVPDFEDLTAVAVPATCAAAHLLGTMVDTLQRSQDPVYPSSAVSFSESIVSMVAAGLRSLPGANARGASSMASFHVTRARQYLTEHLRDPQLSVAGMARALGVSPDYLGRLFRAEPMALSRLIWHKRLEACRRELSDPRQAGRRVSEIAFAWGFNDAAHFARLFRQAFGASPRAWRQAALGSAPLLAPPQGS